MTLRSFVQCGKIHAIRLVVALGAATLAWISASAAREVVRVGIAAEPGVFAALDLRTKKVSGATAEILEAIAEDIGVDLQYEIVAGAGTVPYARAIAEGKIDVVANTYQITPERQVLFDFSDPVVSYGETLVVRKDDRNDYKTAEDLKKLKVAVIAGSNYVDIAKRVGADPVVVGSLDGAVESVDSGKVDVAMGTAPTLTYIVRSGAFANVRIANSYVSHDIRPVGFGLRKGATALLQKINASLAKLKANGTVPKLLTRYGFE